MASKKIIRVKGKKKPVTLVAKNVQRADQEAGEEASEANEKKVISKSGPQPEKEDSSEISDVPKASQTFHIEDPDDEILDASDSMAVELNSSTVKDPVKQVPLEPEEVEPSPKEIPPEEVEIPTFKFFCYRCGQKLKVPIEWANMSTRCLRCEHDIVIPPPLMELES